MAHEETVEAADVPRGDVDRRIARPSGIPLGTARLLASGGFAVLGVTLAVARESFGPAVPLMVIAWSVSLALFGVRWMWPAGVAAAIVLMSTLRGLGTGSQPPAWAAAWVGVLVVGAFLAAALERPTGRQRRPSRPLLLAGPLLLLASAVVHGQADRGVMATGLLLSSVAVAVLVHVRGVAFLITGAALIAVAVPMLLLGLEGAAQWVGGPALVSLGVGALLSMPSEPVAD